MYFRGSATPVSQEAGPCAPQLQMYSVHYLPTCLDVQRPNLAYLWGGACFRELVAYCANQSCGLPVIAESLVRFSYSPEFGQYLGSLLYINRLVC